MLEYFDHLGKLVDDIKNRTRAFDELETLQERTRLAVQSLHSFEQTDTLIELTVLIHGLHQILSSDLKQSQLTCQLSKISSEGRKYSYR